MVLLRTCMRDCQVDRGQRVYKAASENHIKLRIEFHPLISKEKLKCDQTLILPVGIIKAQNPELKKRNIANKERTNGPY